MICTPDAHLELEKDKPVGADEKGKGEQEDDEGVAHEQETLEEEQPVDHLVHVPRRLPRRRTVPAHGSHDSRRCSERRGAGINC